MTEKKWAIYYKKEKENLEEINENLMKHIENLEAENLKISSALSELQADNKEKEVSLDEAHKIIVKLNEEVTISYKYKYSKLMKEYKLLEQYSTEITEENKDCKKYLQEKTKKFDPLFDKLQKQNDKLVAENEKLKKEIQETKGNLANVQNENNKFEKEIKDRNSQINSLKNVNTNLENLATDKDNVIKQNEQKIEELIQMCEKKDEELKMLIKLNQDYSHDTKLSVDEITKQATNTIKMFYNNLNSDEVLSQTSKPSINNSYSLSFREKRNENSLKKSDTFNENNTLFTINELENLMKENKLGLIISEGGNKTSNLNINNNLLSEKTELFSSIFREMNISKYIDRNIFDLKSHISSITNQFDLRFLIKMNENFKLRNEEAETSFNNLKAKYQRLQRENKKLLDKISFFETNFDKLTTNLSTITANVSSKTNKIDAIITKKYSSKDKDNSNNTPESLIKLIEEMNSKFASVQKKYKNKIVELNKEIEQLKARLKVLQEADKALEAVTMNASPKRTPKEMHEEIEKNKVLIDDLTDQTEKYRKMISEIKIELSKQKKILKELQEKNEDLLIQNSELKDDLSLKENKLKLYQDENEKSKILNKNLNFEIEKLKNTQNSNIFDLSSNNIPNTDRKVNAADYDKRQLEELSDSNEKLSKTVIELKSDINREKKSQKELKERIEEISVENNDLKDDLDLKQNKIKNYIEQIERLKSQLKNKLGNIERGDVFSFTIYAERKGYMINDNAANSVKEENESLKREIHVIKKKLEKKESEMEDKYANHNNSNILNSQHNSINESFNEKNYKTKKDEVNKMKDEINRLKDEIASLLKASSNPYPIERQKFKQLQISQKASNFTITKADLPYNNYRIFSSDSYASSESNHKNTDSHANNNAFTGKKCQICTQIIDFINDLKSGLKFSIFKDMKQFYLNYYTEIEKATVKVNEVTQKFSKAESDFNNENIDKKVKVSQVKDILSNSQKLLSLLTVFFSKYNKDIYFYTQNLKKVFDFSQKLVYNSNSSGLIITATNLNLELGTNSNFFKNKPYIITTVLKFFYEFTKIFNQTELRKLYPLYENKTISEVIGYFKTQCESLKSNILESKWDYETEFSELDDSLIIKPNMRRVSELNMNNSYKIVNEKIIKLKKLEYDNSNFTEVLRHYAIVQEIIVKQLYDSSNEINESLDSAKLDKMKNKNDALEKVINITEETLFFKSNELDDDSIHIRRSVIKLLRNQKAILTLSTELL